MTFQIISRQMIRDKARAAFNRGVRRDDHGFNWHSTEAINTWQAEWDFCAQQKRQAQVVVEAVEP